MPFRIIDNFPLVRYLPAPEDQVAFNQAPTPSWLAKWASSDLPSVCIDTYNASCDICLVAFEEPLRRTSNQTTSLMEDAGELELLRQLPCRHVLHHACIEQHLLYSSSCPVCRKPICDQ